MLKFLKKIFYVGKDINISDITEFYYTIASSTNPPEYQRYYFYVKDEKYMFMHEKREGNHWPLIESDVTVNGTIELTNDEWNEFYETICGGSVHKEKEDTSTGKRGPSLFLYWNGGKEKNREYEFESLGKQREFEDLVKRFIMKG